MHEICGEKQEKLLVKTYVLSYFNCRPLVWQFRGKERAIRFIKGDFRNITDVFRNLGEDTLYLNRVQLIAQEVFKSINGQNPDNIKQLLTKGMQANNERKGKKSVTIRTTMAY